MIAGNLPTNQGLGVANEQEQEAAQNQQFWDKVYAGFNPQAPVAQTPSSAPGFNQAATNTQNFQKQIQGVGGPTGSTDMGALSTGIQQKAGNLSRTQDLNSYLSDMEKNQGESNKYQTAAEGRMNGIYGTRDQLSRLPQERELSQANVSDKINQMWNDYINSQNPAENMVGGAAGGLLGKLAGSKLFGPKPPPYMKSLTDIENTENDLQGGP